MLGLCQFYYLAVLVFFLSRFAFLVAPSIPLSHQFGGSFNESFVSSSLSKKKKKKKKKTKELL